MADSNEYHNPMEEDTAENVIPEPPLVDADEDARLQAEEAATNEVQIDDSIVREFIAPLQREERTAPPPNPQASARILATNEEVANQLKNQDKQVDISLKRTYCIMILFIPLVGIFFVICFANKQLEPDTQKIHHVSDSVFITLLTTATANIVALPTIILKYLFAHHDQY